MLCKNAFLLQRLSDGAMQLMCDPHHTTIVSVHFYHVTVLAAPLS